MAHGIFGRKVDTGWLPWKFPRSWADFSPTVCAMEKLLAWWYGITLEYRHTDIPYGTYPNAGFIYLGAGRVRLHGPACRFRIAALCHEIGHFIDFRAGRIPRDRTSRDTLEMRQAQEWSAWILARKRLIALGLWDTTVREYAHHCLASYRVTRRLPL